MIPARPLQTLLADPSLGAAVADVRSVASKELRYLEKRSDFWRQQKPVYAREHEQKQNALKASTRATLKQYACSAVVSVRSLPACRACTAA